MKQYNAIDLFSGCGGLSVGLKEAGFKVIAGIEMNTTAAAAYRLNHPETELIEKDIKLVSRADILNATKGAHIHLVAGCPPCQGFSSVKRLNRSAELTDERNSLILEYIRMVSIIKPDVIMLENVPGIKDYYLFDMALIRLRELKYEVDFKIVNVSQYGIPQRRKRLVLLGQKNKKPEIPAGINTVITVRNAIAHLPEPHLSTDPLHRRYSGHTDRIKDLIAAIPKNGGSRKDLPLSMQLECHKQDNVGFSDVYGRLSWDKSSSTITGGCLKPSKGRFLHPEQNRALTIREAALLQTFPENYKLPENIALDKAALLIGNAFPPKFSYHQALYLKASLNQSINDTQRAGRKRAVKC